MLFKDQLLRTYEDVIKKSENKRDGIIDGIPFPFERFSDYIPSIDRGSHTGLIGSSGTGKSTIARELFVFAPLTFGLKADYPVKVFYFALEDDEVSIIKKSMLYYMYKECNLEMTYWGINSKKRPLNDNEKRCLDQSAAYLKNFMNNLFIIDDCFTPNQIRSRMDEFEAKGYIKQGDHVIVIIDNFSNITPDLDETKHAAIGRLSAEIIRMDFCKKRGYSALSILQTDIESDKNSFRNAGTGKMSLAAIEPSTASIGDNKTVVRSFHSMLGLFNPWKYEIGNYPSADGYDISVLKNNFRSLLLLKSNNGEQTNARLGLRFRGGPGVFEELPSLLEKEQLEYIYTELRNIELAKRERNAQSKMFH